MLGWLAAAAIPFLIHWWSRRRYRETSWAAMEYLLAALRRQAFRIRIEQWTLLGVRTALVVLVVAALAQPYADRPTLASAAAKSTHRLLVFDASYSMQYKPADKTLFVETKELARRIIEAGPEGDAFTLVRMADAPRVVATKMRRERDALFRALDLLEPSAAAANLPAAIPALQQCIRQVSQKHPELAQHEVWFLTDLQQTTWAMPSMPNAVAEFQRRSAELAGASRLFVVDVGRSESDNLAITDLAVDAPPAAARPETSLRVGLKNFGRQPRDRQTLELLVDGRRVAQRQIGIPPDGTATFHFSYSFDQPGSHAVEARTSGDALDIDNQRFLALSVPQAIRALCVRGPYSVGPSGDEPNYLSLALAPQGKDAAKARIQPDVADDGLLLDHRLSDYDCLFLCDVPQFTASEAQALDAYLHTGGTVVFFLGDQVLADRYNEQLGVADDETPQDGAGKLRLLPARIGDPADNPQRRLDPLGFQHPLLNPFRGPGAAGLLTTPVFKYRRLTLPRASQTRTVLALADGSPLIVERSLHRGRVVLMATSLDPSWSALPLWPSFVPLVQELAAWGMTERLRRHNRIVGDSFEVIAPPAAAEASLKIQLPGGREQPAQFAAAGGFCSFHYRAVQPGIYSVEMGPPLDRNELFAVNVATAESDLAKIPLENLREHVWAGIPFQYRASLQERDGATPRAIDKPRIQVPLHTTFLGVALALLLTETLLAWRMGRSSKPTTIAT